MDGCAGHRLPDTANPTAHTHPHASCFLVPAALQTIAVSIQFGAVQIFCGTIFGARWRGAAGTKG